MSKTTIVVCTLLLVALLAGYLYGTPSVDIVIEDTTQVSYTPIRVSLPTSDAITREILKVSGISIHEAVYIASIIRSESNRYKYDWRIIFSIIYAESNFRRRLVSSEGAIGLMQIMPATAKFISEAAGVRYRGPSTLYSPRDNIRLGVYYLRYLESSVGVLGIALTMYNRGGKGRTYKGHDPFRSGVMGMYQKMR